jgi:xanthine/uracil permease
VKQSVNDAKQGAVSLASGGGVLYAGLLFLLLAAMLGLAEVMPAWLAALIVGGVVVIIGLVMVKSGSSKLQPSSFSPDRTAESMRKDKEMVARQTS